MRQQVIKTNKYNQMNEKEKIVWIDLDNSPHVPFFSPIIKEIESRGHKVTLTARDCFQVCALGNLYRLKYRRVGKHYGKNMALKMIGNLYRAMQLLPIAAKAKPSLALSHGSRAMILAARLLNIPTVLMMDYEFVHRIPFMHPALIITPEVLGMDAVGHRRTTVTKYPGIKEDVYVPFFKPDAAIKNRLGLFDDMIIATIRPPANEAHYHNPESDVLFAEVINMLGAIDNLKMIMNYCFFQFAVFGLLMARSRFEPPP